MFCVLFRVFDKEVEDEYHVCKLGVQTYNYITQIPKYSTIIGRYSVLPYYEEIEKSLNVNHCQLINTYQQHCYIANMEWVNDLKGLTPKTWFLGETLYSELPNSSFVLKGITNSRKHQWKTHMFAQSVSDIPNVVSNLLNDTMIKDQGIAIREYVPLKKFEEGINNLPITNEWRVFVWKDRIVTSGYYWCIAENCDQYNNQKIPKKGLDLIQKTINILKDKINFYVIDVAETQNGEWIVIEINDGQMSGLSMIDPYIFYTKLNDIISRL